MEINEIAIIGVGLIGGSIGLAVKKNKTFSNTKVIGIGRSIEKLKLAKQLGAVDEITTDFSLGVKNADIVIISTPVATVSQIVKNILPYVKQGVVITDVGSVKYEIIKEVKQILKNHKQINFVGSHPIAGSEKAGVKFASPELFRGSVCVVCYNPKLSSIQGYSKVKFLWRQLGCKIISLDPKQHDKILATTSHFLHIVSYLLSKQVNANPQYLNFVGGAYRDMTRIANSSAELWSQICFMNRRFIKPIIEKFCHEMEKVKCLIDDIKKLEMFLIKCQNKNLSK